MHERIRDEDDRAFVVIDRREVGDEQHGEFRQPEIVDRLVRQSLDAADHVVAEVTHEATREWRQLRQARTLHRPPRGTEHVERVTADGQPGWHRLHVHAAWPSATDSAATAFTPTNDQRENDRPGSADSSRNVPGRPAASLR